ncbi:MAG: hypothetical protein U1C71_02010, partial [archaeon]|nr:hypothetical protein [archaeon]
PIVCDDLFCFSGEQLFNENDQLLVEGPPFTTQVNKSYDYSFVITSTSPTLYADPKLRVFIANDGFIPSGEVQLTGYEVVGTDGRVLRSTGLATNDVPGGEGQGLSVGTLEQYQTISGKVELLTKQDKATQIKVQLINEGEIVFEHTAGISIGKSGELRVTVDPSMAAAFIPTTFAITVTDDKGFDVQDAMVTLLKIDPSKHQQIISRQFTDIAGKTSLIGPPSLPRTRLVFDAVKAGLASQPITIIVDENVAFFDPATLSFQMPLTGDAEQFLPLRITNKTQQTLILMDARITGDFQGLLANGEMQNFVQQYANVTVIAPLETKTIQVKAATTPSAASFTGQTLRGSLLLTFATQDTQQRWVQQVPMTIALNVVGACDGEAIQFTGAPATGKIDTTAFDNKNQTQFQISNICLVDGQPYTLQNLKAKIVWTSNPIGNVELSTTDIGGSSQSSETLRSNAFVPLFGSFKPAEDTVYASVMTFTPFPQNIGNTAEFTIIIGAEIGSGNARRTIEKSFDVRVQITNLETCIVLDPEPERGIRIESEEDEARFTINTTNCGDVPVDILFCAGANNSNCSGGAPEGRLYLSQFSITDLKGSREITVERRGGTLPGTYDLTVDARVPGTSYKRVAALEVQVDSDLSYAFELDKGGFSLYQQDAKDATTVLNRLFLEQVRVKASICDWKDVYDGVPWDPKFWVDIHPLFGGKASAKAYQNVGAAAGAGAITYIIAAKYAASICAPCAAVIVAIAVLYSLFEDECDKDQTETLMDYIINLTGGSDQQALPPDAIDIRLSPNVRDHITGEWALDAAGLISKGEDTFQQAGVVFTNVSGYTNPNPLFGTVSLRALEHIHGDFAHAGRASVECRNGNFGNLRIGPSPGQGNCSPAEDRVREEKFHLKFRTQDINQSLPPLQFDSVACVSGNTLGQTGKGTLPRIALTWNWNDTTGIPLYACDAGNDQSIFCDATQFNIDLMKRVNAFQEFLSVNTFS